MTSQRKECPQCGVMVKESNLENHLERVHKVSLDEIRGGKDNPREKLVSLVIVIMIIAVAIFGYYWIVVMDSDPDDTGAGGVTIPDGDTGTPDGDTGTPRATITVQGYAQPIVIELEPNRAPVTVDNFVKYANDGFYGGLIFHRVMEDFMIQGGGFYPDMTQKTHTYPPIINEASDSRMRNNRGTIAMARTPDPDSATSQFFINHADNSFLDWDEAGDGHGYCVFGTVIQGMDVVDAIAGVEVETVEEHENVPVQDIIITSVVIS